MSAEYAARQRHMAPAPQPAWASRFREHRKLLGFSQALVAERSGLSQQVVSRLERGELNAQISVWVDACVLGLNAEPADVYSWPSGRELRELATAS